MKRILNTLYITTDGAYLARDGETVLVQVNKDTKSHFPIHALDSIICFGRVSASPPLMALCGERKVALSFMSPNGRFLARVQGPVSGNVLLRRTQYRVADDESHAFDLARAFILAKLANCRYILRRAARDHNKGLEKTNLTIAADRLRGILQHLPNDVDGLRGCEGDAARTYFGVFDNLITSQKDAFYFKERSRRPPLDNLNAVMSFCYTLLAHDVAAALEGVGLDPAVGFLHKDRPGRPSLALDMMEEFRPIMVDRLVLNLINRRQINGKGFKDTESGAVHMNDATRKEVLVAYQKRKQEEIQHPFTKEKMHFGLAPHVQALLLARHLRGELDGYPAFLWR